MARQPRKTRTKQAETEKLVAAIKFVAASHRTGGAIYQDHFTIQNKTVIAFDGILAAGALIDEDLCVYPNIKQVLASIDHCKTASSLTQINPQMLRISSSSFRANIQCTDASRMQHAWPDDPTVAINQGFIEALIIAGKLVSDTADNVIQASVMVTDHMVASTDNGMAIQIWTGIGTCGHTVAVPKVFINLLAKTSKEPSYLGIGKNSLTVFYTDNSWYRTQLYDVSWPPIDRVFTHSDDVVFGALEPDFHKAVADVLPFVESNVMFIADNIIASHTTNEHGAFAAMKFSMGNFKTNAKHLSLLKDMSVQMYGIYDIPDNEIFYANGVTSHKMLVRLAISPME
jgi:hypothetical protein